MKCPYCGEEIKKGNGWHIKRCEEKWVKENFTDEYKNTLYRLYITEEKSVRETAEELNISVTQLVRFLTYANIPQRDIKKANQTHRRNELRAKTSIERYGVPHNFCKNSQSRLKWEKRLLDEEGITNVFQRDSVKTKIRETNIKKYGEEGVKYNRIKGSTLSYWIDKLGEEEGIKRFNEINYKKRTVIKEHYLEKYGDLGEAEWLKHIDKCRESAKFTRYTGLNDKFEKLLNENDINNYIREYTILRSDNSSFYSYDFKICNVIVELNGVYWHCSPKKYKANDLVRFPNNVYIKASDKWDYDKKKIDYSKFLGYETFVIWEDEFNEKSKEIINYIKENNYAISKN